MTKFWWDVPSRTGCNELYLTTDDGKLRAMRFRVVAQSSASSTLLTEGRSWR